MSSLADSLDEYTYEDYDSWGDSVRCELIDGVVYMMAPPSIWHQEVLGDIFNEIKNYLKGQKCKVFVSPIGVRLFPRDDNQDTTIVEPDIIIVCDENKLSDGKTCRGAPDVVIEILSDGTKSHDLNFKKDLYQRAGVKEYIVVSRDYIKCHVLVGDNYEIDKHSRSKSGADIFISSINAGFTM
jgi:Uma2 family endonuclease